MKTKDLKRQYFYYAYGVFGAIDYGWCKKISPESSHAIGALDSVIDAAIKTADDKQQECFIYRRDHKTGNLVCVGIVDPLCIRKSGPAFRGLKKSHSI